MENDNRLQEKNLKSDNVTISAEGERGAQRSAVPSLDVIQEDFFKQKPAEVTNEKL